MSIRKLAVLLAVVCASALLVPVAAGAQTTSTHATSLSTVPVTGTAANGKSFKGRYHINHFVTRNGKTYAVGTLTGKVGHRSVKRSNVQMPVKSGTGALAGTSATCPILHLVLGPLDLNLLGLKVHLNTVVLDITAQSGPGLLLGNLLCSVAHLLDGPSLLGSQVSSLLNIVQQLLGNPALLNL